MSDLRFSLLRTVFLPKSSPGISSINELRTDLREVELTLVAPQQLLIKGEMDILVDYNALPPAGESINNSGEPWQALISLPFELTEQVQLAEVTDCRLSARARPLCINNKARQPSLFLGWRAFVFRLDQ